MSNEAKYIIVQKCRMKLFTKEAAVAQAKKYQKDDTVYDEGPSDYFLMEAVGVIKADPASSALELPEIN